MASLDQLGQGYMNPPNGQQPFWGSVPALMQQALGQVPGSPYYSAAAMGIGSTAQGVGYGVSPGGPTGPAGSVDVGPGQLTGPQYGLPTPADSAPGSGGQPPGNPPAGAPTGITTPQPAANPPASGSGYGQSLTAPGSGFNPSGFGGLGTAYSGRYPGIGARYWARLNNIGGS